jgi:hypothetical protein
MKKNIVILIIAILVAGGAGFYGGLQYSKKAAAKVSATAGANRAGFAGARAGNRSGAGFISGQIIAKTDNGLTIKSATGGSQIVFLAPSSQIMESSTTTIANLNVGESVMVTGTTNSDGSVTARTVQVGNFRFGGPGRPDSSQPGANGQIQGQVQGEPGQAIQTPPVQGR